MDVCCEDVLSASVKTLTCVIQTADNHLIFQCASKLFSVNVRVSRFIRYNERNSAVNGTNQCVYSYDNTLK